MRAFFLLLVVFVTACGAGGMVVPDHAGRDEADVRGEKLYRARCAACHRLRDPAEHTVAEWHEAISEYGREARLDSGEETLLRGFLTKHASDAPAIGLAAPALNAAALPASPASPALPAAPLR